MRTKDSTVECAFTPELTKLLFLIDAKYRELGDEVIITSGSELHPPHADTSLHFSGNAADLRLWNINLTPKELYAKILEVCHAYCIANKIPINWVDLILEKDHLHVEYQPKRIRK